MILRECCFIFLNVCGILVSVFLIIMNVDTLDIENEVDSLKLDVCPVRIKDVYENYEDALDRLTISAAVFGACIVYPLGIAAGIPRTRKKLLLLVYIGGTGVLIVTHLTLLIVSCVRLANFGFDKESYTECLGKKLDNFNESNPDSYVAGEFEHYKCCSPDGNIVDFWNGTNWHKDPNRNQHDVEVPIQCCKNPDSDSCRIKGSGNDDRLTVGCWEKNLQWYPRKTIWDWISTILLGLVIIFIDGLMGICCAFQTLLDEFVGGLHRGQRGSRQSIRGSRLSLGGIRHSLH